MRIRQALFTALAAAGLARAQTLTAQASDPPYLRDFPSVDRVKQAMRVSDPRETALRQIGAFWQLQEILKVLSGRREFRGFTPGEGKLIGEYGVAEYYAAQAADSAFPGPYGNMRKLSDNTPYRYARTDPRFGVEGIEVFKTLLTPAIQDQFDQVAGVDRARIAARAKADAEANARGGYVVAGQPPSAGDEERREIRRCVESGRSEATCLTEGIGNSFRNLIGLPSDLLPPKPTGLRLAGTYPGPGKFSLTFGFDNVQLACEDLVPRSVEYAFDLTANPVRVTLAIDKAPMVFTVRADGTLAGPAAADIAGQIVVGQEQWIRTYSDGRQEPYLRPVYGPATRHCAIGVLTVSSPTTPIPASMTDVMAGGLDRLAQQIPSGLRMAGEYGSRAELDIDFRPEGAVVGCGEVAVLRQYSAQVVRGQVVIAVKNGASPFTLALGADGRLTGSGTVRVDGRVMTGKTPNGELAYAPRSASCALGALAPAPRP